MAENTTYADLTQRLGKIVVEGVARAQKRQIAAVRRARELVERFTPELPELPLGGWLPRPQQVARANFALAEEFLKAQKSYTLGLLDALTGEKTPKRRRAAKAAA